MVKTKHFTPKGFLWMTLFTVFAIATIFGVVAAISVLAGDTLFMAGNNLLCVFFIALFSVIFLMAAHEEESCNNETFFYTERTYWTEVN